MWRIERAATFSWNFNAARIKKSCLDHIWCSFLCTKCQIKLLPYSKQNFSTNFFLVLKIYGLFGAIFFSRKSKVTLYFMELIWIRWKFLLTNRKDLSCAKKLSWISQSFSNKAWHVFVGLRCSNCRKKFHHVFEELKVNFPRNERVRTRKDEKKSTNKQAITSWVYVTFTALVNFL